MYAAFDNHKNEDFKPYLLKSTDAGKTWTSIAGDLPENGPVLAFAEDTVNPNLLFAGTEFGAFFTIDGGQHWVQLKGGLPTIAVRDMVIQAREGDLVIATFGRGFYVLDDITPLRQMKAESTEQACGDVSGEGCAAVCGAASAGRAEERVSGGRVLYTAENPPYGAVFTAYLKEKIKTKKEKRQEAEKDAAKKNQTPAYPTNDELRAEAEEAKPEVYFVVYDESGAAIRRVECERGRGIPAGGVGSAVSGSAGAEAFRRGRRGFSGCGGSGASGAVGDLLGANVSRKSGGVVTELAGPQSFKVGDRGSRRE